MENKNTYINQDFNNPDDIDLKNIYRTLKRGKKIIFGITIISSLLGIFYAYSLKPKWLGSFNIVVKKNQTENRANSSFIPSLLDLKTNDENETQKLILKSPSVLMPVFEYVKNYYKENGIDTKNLNFKDWVKNNLTIDFEDKSSVLKVELVNEDKEFIMNTLNLISSKFQIYSKRDTKKQIIKTIDYLEKQTEIMKEKAKLSIKEFNEFSIKNGLGNIDGFVGFGNSTSISNSLYDTNLSKSLGTTTNDNQLSFLNNISSKKGNIKQNNPGIRFNNQFQLLEEYEASFADLSSKLKPNSKTLKELSLKIENLRERLKRPNEILIEYRKLNAKAIRDESILQELESSLEILKLNKIKTPDPWEMISVPTVDNAPVYPKKKNLIFIFIFTSTVFGSIITLLKEKFSGKIFELNDFILHIRYKYLGNLYKNNLNINQNIINDVFNSKNSEDLALWFLNDNFFEERLSNEIKILEDMQIIKIVNPNNISKLSNSTKILLITQEGCIKFNNLELVDKYLLPYKNQVLGWFSLI